jgi:N-carbamoylputrescine amidase
MTHVNVSKAREQEMRRSRRRRPATEFLAALCYAEVFFFRHSRERRPVGEVFRAGLIQMACGPDPERNLEHAGEMVREAAARGANVICLPELFLTQYFCQREDAALFDLAEPIPGPTTHKLSALARAEKIVLIASLFEKRAPGIYHNTAACFDTDGVLKGIYRKMHIPDDPLYYEKYYFTPGDLGYRALETAAGKIGTLVCWDQWYPEGARLTALQGASVLFYPTAIGWHPAEREANGAVQHDAWRTIQRSHAIANGVYVAVVNRVGHETGNVRGKEAPGAGLDFWGGSFVCDAFGTVLAEASQEREEVLVAEVDLGKLEEVRRNWPFLRDRRIDSYGAITRRFLDSPAGEGESRQGKDS